MLETMESDISRFQNKVDYYKHNKHKLLLPKCSNEFIASVAIVTYLTERVKQFKGEV